jgi:acyl-CoA synthetase (AMP-forming)/AMP-acid ligase II
VALLRDLTVLARAGVLSPTRPDKLLGQANALLGWGTTLVSGYLCSAIRAPERTAVIDDEEAVSFAELVGRAAALAHELRDRDIHHGDSVAIAQRNSVSYVVSLLAAGLAGADVVLLNVAMPAAQIRGVLTDQQVQLSLVDAACAPLVDGPAILVRPQPATPYTSIWHQLPSPPARPGRLVVLTSGTTGPPKGARRPTPKGLSAPAAVLSRLPVRAEGTTIIPAPLFHTWGLGNLQLATPLRSTVVLSASFTPEGLLELIARHRAEVVAAVPVMIQRLLEAPDGEHDVSCLRVVATAGSAIPAEVVTRFMDRFGDVLYNIYGSTEVSWATIADPAQLRRDPRSAGTPPHGTRVAILDEQQQPVPHGEVGDILVGNDMIFEGYTGAAGSATMVKGLYPTGDRGHLLSDGCLVIDGRSDDMVISGGENVYPRQTEDTIQEMPGVREVAVVGVEDAQFGQRLVAYVVGDVEPDAVKTWVRERLARFAVPRDVVLLDELPRNATGKVVPRELTPPA